MFSKEFLDLTKYANTKTTEKFANNKAIEPNPFFIGFGNPNSDILIVGQELAIDPIKNPVALEMESYRNPEHWNKIISENISDLNYSFNGENGYKNPMKPYTGKAKGTWKSYESIVEKIKNIKYDDNLEFFKHCFLTEINTPVSKSKAGYKNNLERESLIRKEFYRNFPIVLLAIGDYANEKIENLFNVIHSKKDSDTTSQKRFEVYYSEDRKRVLVNTRQLSNFFFKAGERDSYFEKISDFVK